MKAIFVARHGSWRYVALAANETIGKDGGGKKEPSEMWKKRILLSEHSPIRVLSFTIRFEQLKSWVSTHLVRHNIGIQHFVRTQRKDRTGVDRDKLPQDAPVSHRIVINPQAMINISRKRLCNNASTETQEAC